MSNFLIDVFFTSSYILCVLLTLIGMVFVSLVLSIFIERACIGIYEYIKYKQWKWNITLWRHK